MFFFKKANKTKKSKAVVKGSLKTSQNKTEADHEECKMQIFALQVELGEKREIVAVIRRACARGRVWGRRGKAGERGAKGRPRFLSSLLQLLEGLLNLKGKILKMNALKKHQEM